MLVVEGESDARAMRALLAADSSVLRSALRNAHLVIDHLSGAGKLSYKLSELRNLLCGYHVFVDHDDAGRSAAERAQADGLLRPADLHFATCQGKKNSEWEDLVAVSLYEKWVQDDYGVALAGAKFQNAKPWSERMSETFLQAGRTWNDKTRLEIKTGIAHRIEAAPGEALNSHTRGAFDGLKAAIERKVLVKAVP